MRREADVREGQVLPLEYSSRAVWSDFGIYPITDFCNGSSRTS